MADICASTITKNLALWCNSCPCSFPYHICVFDQHSTFNSHNISWNSCFIGILLLLHTIFCPIVCAGSKQQFKAVQSRVVALQKAAKCVGCYCLSSPFFMCIQSKHLNCSAPLHNISFCEFHSGSSVNSYSTGKVVILAKISNMLTMKNLCKQFNIKSDRIWQKLTLCTSCGGGMIAARRWQCSGFHGPPDD